jgi:hypothetical protein|tara:strand:- start:310 stop:747 length:438 start_codon:yes stop_codon:yes gene_type:complete
MRSSLILLAVLGLFGLTGCSADYDAAMKIEKSKNDFQVLMGTFDGSLALVHGSVKNATISMTDGSLTCDGTSNSGTFSTDMAKNKVKHLFSISCDDGRTGQLVLSITGRPSGIAGLNASGAGIGKLNDGSKIKVVIGDASATLGW